MQINSINNTSFGKVYIDDSARNELIKAIIQSKAPADVYKHALVDMIATENDDKMILSAKLDDSGSLRLNLKNNHIGTSETIFGPNGFMLLLKSMRPNTVKELLTHIKNEEC